MIRCWIEAMRLRTLPVSCSGVIVASGLTSLYGCFKPVPAVLCLLFAVLAQIASNFANEYYDFRAGLDRRGRIGPRRGVTEGDITPRAMLTATFATLGVACVVGCSLICYGGWLLVPAGIVIALGALAYSAGPYPLSRHALGEVAVVIFFGIVPVNMTFYIMSGQFALTIMAVSVGVGLMGANILLVNNYRDVEDDRAVGKHTLATRFGTMFASRLYLFNGYIAVALMVPLFMQLPLWASLAPVFYLMLHTMLWTRMIRMSGASLNPMLGLTAMTMLCFSVLFAAEAALLS